MSTRHQPGDIEKLNGNRSPSLNTGAVIRLAAIGNTEPGACAGDLEIPNCSLWVDGCKREVADLGAGIGQAATKNSAQVAFITSRPSPIQRG